MQADSQETKLAEIEIRIEASPETIFPFFTDPEKMKQWKGVEATLDPRPGGIYRVNVTGGDIARGEYVEIVPHSKVVFTWGWEGGGTPLPPGASTVEITLTPDGSTTILRLRHMGLTEEQATEHARGWDHYLPRLAAVAAGNDPGPDPWVRPAAAS